jgi:hypothetical protein
MPVDNSETGATLPISTKPEIIGERKYFAKKAGENLS